MESEPRDPESESGPEERPGRRFSPQARPAMEHDDPGMQPERTAQSWIRTGLSATVVSLVFLKWIADFHGFALLVFAFCLLAAISLIPIQFFRYHHGSRSIRNEEARPAPRSVFYLAGLVCLISVFGIATALGVGA